MPAMGDLRKCMIALAGTRSLMTSVCEHRFDNPESFAGHSLGNLILSALYQMNGNFAAAVQQACELLQLKGRVLPATESFTTLCAMYDDGRVVRGEANIPVRGRKISKVWLESDWGDLPAAAPGVLEALQEADATVLGPGSLFTSLIPNLLVPGIAEAINESSAMKVYISNLMTQAGETDGYSAVDHLRVLQDYVPAIDVCVLNSSSIGTEVAERYLKLGAQIVSGTTTDEDEVRKTGVIPVLAPLLKDGDIKARHDPEILARLVVSLARGFAGAHEIICGQRNGR
jgi:uncharacterized cofD-like protein